MPFGFRLRPRSEKPRRVAIDPKMMEALTEVLLKIIGESVKDKWARAILVGLVVAASQLTGSEEPAVPPAPAPASPPLRVPATTQ